MVLGSYGEVERILRERGVMTRKHRHGTFQEFKKFSLDVVKGKRQVDPSEAQDMGRIHRLCHRRRARNPVSVP